MEDTNPIARLRRLDVCAVSDALDKLGLAGFVNDLPPRTSSQRIAGRVVTYKLEKKPTDPGSSGSQRHLGTTAVEAAQTGDIVVVEQRTGIDAGSWGGNLSLGAKMRRVAGVIVDGPVRDIDEARSYGFPVYARSTTARTARGRLIEASTNQPVVIGTVHVAPGDYAIADASGVAFIQSKDIDRVLDAAESIASIEAAMAKAILNGIPISKVMGGHYENMLG